MATIVDNPGGSDYSIGSNKLMKKTLLIILVFLVIIGGILMFRNYKVATNLENKCIASGGGWAPYWTQKDCDGKQLEADSDLVIGDKTCWCHQPNTCWNGHSCVPISNTSEN